MYAVGAIVYVAFANVEHGRQGAWVTPAEVVVADADDLVIREGGRVRAVSAPSIERVFGREADAWRYCEEYLRTRAASIQRLADECAEKGVAA